MKNNLSQLVDRANQVIHSTFNQLTIAESELKQAMHYSLTNGGKRIRPLLIYCIGQSLQVDLNKLDKLAVAIEFIHTYSLVHDDLPAMDNDDLRRGQLTCHIKFNESTAILVGDALQAEAFNVLCEQNLPPDIIVSMIKSLTHAIGSNGMVGGQALDLKSHPDINQTHQLKTGALIAACAELALLACQTESRHIINFTRNIGTAFQLQDDLFDQENLSNQMPETYFKLAKINLNQLKNPAPLQALLNYLETRTY